MCFDENIAYEKAELQEELEAGYIDYEEYNDELDDIESRCESFYNDDYNDW